MRKILVSMAVIPWLVACPSEKRREEERRTLNDVSITVTPPPGTYQFEPWVVVESFDPAAGSIMVSAPNKPFAAGESCMSEELRTKEGTVCVEIQESGTLRYYLSNWPGQGDILSADYEILKQIHPVALTSTHGDETETFDLNEMDTLCAESKLTYYEGQDQKTERLLSVVIKTNNEDHLPANTVGYFAFKIPLDAVGEYTLTTDSDGEVGLVVRSESEHRGVPYLGLFDYSSKTLDDAEEPQCRIAVDNLGINDITSGTVECSNLAVKWPEGVIGKKLGDKIHFSANWQCDRYLFSR